VEVGSWIVVVPSYNSHKVIAGVIDWIVVSSWTGGVVGIIPVHQHTQSPISRESQFDIIVVGTRKPSREKVNILTMFLYRTGISARNSVRQACFIGRIGIVGLVHRSIPSGKVSCGHKSIALFIPRKIKSRLRCQVVFREIPIFGWQQVGFKRSICGKSPTCIIDALIFNRCDLTYGSKVI